MKISVVPGKELAGQQMLRWADLQQNSPALASPYFCPEFTAAVAAVRDDVYVGVLEEATETVGFFPFQRGRMRVGKPVGWPMSDYQGVVIADERWFDAAELVRGCGLSVWHFDHLIASQVPFRPYHRVAAESPMIDLSHGYEAYKLAQRRAGSRLLEQICRKERKLEREVGPLRFEVHEVDPTVLGKLIDWKREQYRRTGLLNVLGFAWTVELVERIHATKANGFAGILSVLYVADDVAAAHMGMRSKDVWHWWFPSYNHRFGKYSPGLILLLRMMECAPAHGIRQIDLGKGDDRYKQCLVSHAVPLAEGCVALPSLASTLRRTGNRIEAWYRTLPLPGFVRAPARMIRRAGKWLDIR